MASGTKALRSQVGNPEFCHDARFFWSSLQTLLQTDSISDSKPSVLVCVFKPVCRVHCRAGGEKRELNKYTMLGVTTQKTGDQGDLDTSILSHNSIQGIGVLVYFSETKGPSQVGHRLVSTCFPAPPSLSCNWFKSILSFAHPTHTTPPWKSPVLPVP